MKEKKKKAADIEKRRWDDVRRLVDLAKIKIGQVVYWRMDISTIVLVRIHTVSVSPDNTIEYSASSLYGDEISFTDEQIGKEIFVDLGEAINYIIENMNSQRIKNRGSGKESIEIKFRRQCKWKLGKRN